MALIIRIDVDRPYGKSPFLRHVLSRLSSDLYFPAVKSFGYLNELEVVLKLLNSRRARSYVFFRRCTLPSARILTLLDEGKHEVGLHLEDSRSFESFSAEKDALERKVGRKILAVSKHGSGESRYGLRHFAPYEPEKYVEWAQRSGMSLFLGNLEDPSIHAYRDEGGMHVFPSAFWLEPAWRDTSEFSVDWLCAKAQSSDVVLLIHPENVLAVPDLVHSFKFLLTALPSRIVA